MSARLQRSVTLVALGVALLVAGCERPPVETVQRGYRGLGMVEVFNPRAEAVRVSQNQVPAPIPAASPGGPPGDAAGIGAGTWFWLTRRASVRGLNTSTMPSPR